MRRLAANRRLMALWNLGYVGLCLLCFHKRLNLKAFGLADVCIGHLLLRPSGKKALSSSLKSLMPLYVRLVVYIKYLK